MCRRTDRGEGAKGRFQRAQWRSTKAVRERAPVGGSVQARKKLRRECESK